MMAMIRLEHVNKYYGQGATRFHVLHDINLQVAAGELMAIIGESGSGKSTLINIIGFLDDDFEGNYFYNDQAIHDYTRADFAKLRNQHVGFVFQNFKLIRDISIAENVILPLLYAGVGRRQAKKTAARVLSRVGLGGYDDKLPTELSGGQQQRVSIARAIIANPDFLIADEPTGALDTKTSQEIMDLFKQLNQTQHTTIIMVTHDPRVAEQCERVVKIIDGRIVDDRKVGAN